MRELIIDGPSGLPFYAVLAVGAWIPYALLVLLVWVVHSAT